MLNSRSKYSGIRVNKEAAMVLAMNVALYEGTWENTMKVPISLHPPMNRLISWAKY